MKTLKASASKVLQFDPQIDDYRNGNDYRLALCGPFVRAYLGVQGNLTPKKIKVTVSTVKIAGAQKVLISRDKQYPQDLEYRFKSKAGENLGGCLYSFAENELRKLFRKSVTRKRTIWVLITNLTNQNATPEIAK